MREIRTSGSEGGGTGNSTSSSYPYQTTISLVCDVTGTSKTRNYARRDLNPQPPVPKTGTLSN